MPKYEGVYPKGKKFYGAKWYKGKTHCTKCFDTAEEASRAKIELEYLLINGLSGAEDTIEQDLLEYNTVFPPSNITIVLENKFYYCYIDYKNEMYKIEPGHSSVKEARTEAIRGLRRLIKHKLTPEQKLRYSIATKISRGLKNKYISGKWVSILGYTIEQLKRHLENNFKSGMSWKNYGLWHIDHIIPVSLWQFNTTKDREFKQCWSRANLQPLWAKDNLRKSNKCF